MASQNITIAGNNWNAVPSIKVPKQSSGNAEFFDVTDTTAVASDVASGKYFYLASGQKVSGGLSFVTYYTGSSTPSSSLGSNGDIYLKTS